MVMSMAMVGIAMLTFVFTYLVIYKKNRVAGNIFYAVEGLGIVYIDTRLAYLGILVFMGALVSFIYDWMRENKA